MDWFAAIAGGFIGGVLGVIGTIMGSYYGPRQLEKWRDERQETRLFGPRKNLLRKLLQDSRFKSGRTLVTLSLVTGTTDEECRRLLIEIGARGILLKNKVEGWTLQGIQDIKKA